MKQTKTQVSVRWKGGIDHDGDFPEYSRRTISSNERDRKRESSYNSDISRKLSQKGRF